MIIKYSKNLQFSLLFLLFSTLFCLNTFGKNPEEQPDWRDAALNGENNGQIENNRSIATSLARPVIAFNGQVLAPKTTIKSPAELEREQQDHIKRMERDEALRRYAFPLSDKELVQLREKGQISDPFDFTLLSKDNQDAFKRLEHRFATPLSSDDRANVLPAYVSNVTILYGPTGNGKTESVKAHAKQMGAHFIHIPSSLLVNEYQGSGAQNVKREIEKALEVSKAKNKIVYLLFDEIDMIARSGGSDKQHQSEQAATATLWQKLDEYRSNGRLHFWCSTNGFDSVDQRLRNRASAIEFTNPNKSQRAQILNFWIKQNGIDLATILKLTPKQTEVFVKDLAGKTDGFSRRSMARLVHEFRTDMNCLKDTPEKITRQLFYDHLKKIRENIFANALEQSRSLSIFGYHPLAALEGKYEYWKPAIDKAYHGAQAVATVATIAIAGAQAANFITRNAAPWVAPAAPIAAGAKQLLLETAAVMRAIIFAR